MGIFKTFKEWLAERPDTTQQRRLTGAVSKSLKNMAPDQAMGAIQGNDQQAQKNLIAKSLAKPGVGSIDDIAPIVGVKVKNPLIPQMMRKK